MLWVPTRDGRKTQLEPSVKIQAAKLGIDLVRVWALYAEVGSGTKAMPTKLPKAKPCLSL